MEYGEYGLYGVYGKYGEKSIKSIIHNRYRKVGWKFSNK